MDDLGFFAILTAIIVSVGACVMIWDVWVGESSDHELKHEAEDDR